VLERVLQRLLGLFELVEGQHFVVVVAHCDCLLDFGNSDAQEFQIVMELIPQKTQHMSVLQEIFQAGLQVVYVV